MMKKTESIYIRTTIPEKEEIGRLARTAGESISSFVLGTIENHLLEKKYKMLLCPHCKSLNLRKPIKCKDCKKSY